MEFESWNRDTLLTEVKSAMISANCKPFNTTGLSSEITYFSDGELKKKNDYQLRIIYVEFKRQDKTFRQENICCSKASRSLDIHEKMLFRWIKEQKDDGESAFRGRG